MNTAFRTSARNPDPVTSQESAVAIRATLEGYHGRIIEAMRQHGPMTQKEIAAATGIAEISCGLPLRPMERAVVLEEGEEPPIRRAPLRKQVRATNMLRPAGKPKTRARALPCRAIALACSVHALSFSANTLPLVPGLLHAATVLRFTQAVSPKSCFLQMRRAHRPGKEIHGRARFVRFVDFEYLGEGRGPCIWPSVQGGKPLSDLEAIERWGKTNGGTARDIRMQCPGLKARKLREISKICERLVAEGRLQATRVPVPDSRYLGRSLGKSSQYMQPASE